MARYVRFSSFPFSMGFSILKRHPWVCRQRKDTLGALIFSAKIGAIEVLSERGWGGHTSGTSCNLAGKAGTSA